jgi:hypothetical protein
MDNIYGDKLIKQNITIQKVGWWRHLHAQSDFLLKYDNAPSIEINEIFHEKFAELLGQPTAEYFLVDNKNSNINKRLVTKNFVKSNEEITHFNNVFPTLNGQYLQKFNLKNVLPLIKEKLNEQAAADFVNLWLTNWLFANYDQYQGHNVGIIKDKQPKDNQKRLKKLAPNFDYGVCGLITFNFNNNTDISRISHIDLNKISAYNLDFLRNNYREEYEEFFDKLNDVQKKKYTDIDKLFDFSAIDIFDDNHETAVDTANHLRKFYIGESGNGRITEMLNTAAKSNS